MIYLDNGATSLRKPPAVALAMRSALYRCANPGRGGHPAAMEAAKTVYRCRKRAGELFECAPEQVVFTSNCTHSLNIAIRSIAKAGNNVIVSGFEHNAVTRPLHGIGANICVAGRKLFDWEDSLSRFEDGLKGADAAVFTHVSNVFGYILPVEEMARLCRDRGIPFVIDAAQSAGSLPVSMAALGADFIAMPGHKGLLGPQGTGILLCKDQAQPLLYGGTGSESVRQDMPDFLPDRLEAGTVNVPGIAGLCEGLKYLSRVGMERIHKKEMQQLHRCMASLQKMGFQVFAGEHQSATVSFIPPMDCEEAAQRLAQQGIAVRAGLHCAPLAHESAGTLQSGTVRVSFGFDAEKGHTDRFVQAAAKLKPNVM